MEMGSRVSEAHALDPLTTARARAAREKGGWALPDWGPLGREPRRPFCCAVFDARGRFTFIPDIN